MLQAMNTGHDGSLTTLHANSPEDVVDRMITMVRYAVNLPVDAIEAQIGNAFHYIVQVSRGSDGSRFLQAIAEVVYDRRKRVVSIERVFERESFSDKGAWKRVPALVDEVRSHPSAFPIPVEELDVWEGEVFGR